MKTCSKCRDVKQESEFYAQRQYNGEMGLMSQCKDCIRTKRKEHYTNNTVAVRAANNEWANRTAENKEKMRAYKAAYQARNRDSKNASRMAKYYADIERYRERGRQYAKNRKQLQAAYNAAHRKANPEKFRAYVTNRRARLRLVEGSHTAAQVVLLFERQRGCCVICRAKLPKSYHKDHIQPLARGGNNDILNIQLLCRTCNQTKSARDPVGYMQERGFLL